MAEELDFTLKDIELLNRVIIGILEIDKMYKKSKDAINSLKKMLRQVIVEYEELKDKRGYPVFHKEYKENNTVTDLFIHLKEIVILKSSQGEGKGFGYFVIEISKRFNIPLGLKKLLPVKKKETPYKSISIHMIREAWREKVNEFLSNLDKSFCGKKYKWVFIGILTKGKFTEKKSKILIPTPIIFYRSKKGYYVEPTEYSQVNVNKILGLLNLDPIQ